MKKLIRKIINQWGYDIVKINVHSAKQSSKIVPVKVGNFTISMSGNSPQISNYKYYQLNSQLGRLAVIVKNNFPLATVVDVGANAGDTVAVIKSVADLPVIAIEGDPISYKFLKQNCKQFDNVYCIEQFLGEEKKSLEVNFDQTGFNTTLKPVKGGTHKVNLKTLDETLAENELFSKKIKLLKIDVEGFDTIVLTLSEHKPVLYFEYNRYNMDAIKEDGLSTLLSLKNLGYHQIILFDAKNRYIASVPISEIDLITQLHFYANGDNTMIPYFDICMFHDDDEAAATEFIKGEYRRD
jgi:FkbM family methyltransferase